MSRICAIFASDLKGGIGYKGAMPWPRLREDMLNFSQTTTPHTVIMGRQTWDSDMPKPLSKRHNVVITSRGSEITQNFPSVVTASGPVDEVINLLKGVTLGYEWWVIGGANVLRQWLPYCEQVRYTKIHGEWECDTFLDPAEWQSDLEQISSRPYQEQKICYNIETWFNPNPKRYR